MTTPSPKNRTRSASPAGGYTRVEKLVLRSIFYPFLALAVFYGALALYDNVFRDGTYYYESIAVGPGIVATLFGLLLWKGKRAEARHRNAVHRSSSPRRPRPGTVPDAQLTPEQQLVRKHFPGAVFETAASKQASARASEARMARHTSPIPSRPRSIVPSNWRSAERSAAQWMSRNGYPDARVTPEGADGGIDVISSLGIAQVKHQRNPVGSAVIQQLRGAASSRAHQHRAPLFFSSYGFTAPARQVAQEMGVLLYQFDGTTWRRVA